MKLLLALNILISAVTLTVAIDANRISRENRDKLEEVSATVDAISDANRRQYWTILDQSDRLQWYISRIVFSKPIFYGMTEEQRDEFVKGPPPSPFKNLAQPEEKEPTQ